MDITNFTKTFHRLLNEGRAEAFRDAYYPDVDDYILNKIIEIDPKSNGDDLSEYGKFLLKLKPTQSDIVQVGKDIEIYAKAVENGAEVPDMSEIESLENLHYIAVDIANEKSHLNSDEMRAQEDSFNCPVLFDDGGLKVIEITSEDAAEYYGGGTMWPWAGRSSEGSMFNQFAQMGKIYVIESKVDGKKYSVMKRGNRLRISDSNDELVEKSIFPSELLNTLTSIAENYKQEKKSCMNESIVKGMVSALYENYDKKHIKGNELKTSMNNLCECISDKSKIKSEINDRLNIVVEAYSSVGKNIDTVAYPEIMNIVCEGFGDTIADFKNRVKGKLVGTPEEAAATSDAITNAIVKKLHEIYPMAQQYAGKNLKGFSGTMVKLCLMVGEDALIDSILRPIIQREVERALENNPTTNYRDRKRCFNYIKDCFGYAGGMLYSTSDLLDAVKNAVGIHESKNNSTTLNENELNELLVEAVSKNIKQILSESELWHASDEDPVDDNARPEDDENFSNECKITETELTEMVKESVEKALYKIFSK